jgi:hypothetical protein
MLVEDVNGINGGHGVQKTVIAGLSLERAERRERDSLAKLTIPERSSAVQTSGCCQFNAHVASTPTFLIHFALFESHGLSFLPSIALCRCEPSPFTI